MEIQRLISLIQWAQEVWKMASGNGLSFYNNFLFSSIRDILFILIVKLSEDCKFVCILRGNVCSFLLWQGKNRLGLDSQKWSIRARALKHSFWSARSLKQSFWSARALPLKDFVPKSTSRRLAVTSFKNDINWSTSRPTSWLSLVQYLLGYP